MRTEEDYARQNLDIHFETWATEIDPAPRSCGRTATRSSSTTHSSSPRAAAQAAAVAWL